MKDNTAKALLILMLFALVSLAISAVLKEKVGIVLNCLSIFIGNFGIAIENGKLELPDKLNNTASLIAGLVAVTIVLISTTYASKYVGILYLMIAMAVFIYYLLNIDLIERALDRLEDSADEDCSYEEEEETLKRGEQREDGKSSQIEENI